MPAGLALDLFEDRPYVGLAAFRVTGLRLRGLLAPPLVSGFLQLNVRTYVTDGERRGIWFFSLETTSVLASEAARRIFGLPFHRSEIALRPDGRWTALTSARAGTRRPAVFEARFRAHGRAVRPQPGTLEHFLTERYCLYSLDPEGDLCRAEIHHRPWKLRAAEIEVDLNSTAPEGIEVLDEQSLAHVSESQDFLLWPPRVLG